jgi:DNA-binding transcriptional ArsR family regulator
MDERLEQEINLLHARVCSGLADPTRVMILYALAEEPRYVGELTEELGLPQPTVSRHLKILRDRSLVKSERSGASVFYSLTDKRVIEALDLLRAVLHGILTQQAELIEALDIG